MIEHRQRLLQERTRAKNRMRALLRAHGITAREGLVDEEGDGVAEAQEFPTNFDALQRDMLLRAARIA